MKYLSDLKVILYDYVKENIKLEQQEDTLSYNISLYEEVLSYLSECINDNYGDTIGFSICLDTLFGNKYDELLQCIYASKKLKSLNMKDNKLSSKIIEITNEIKDEYSNIKSKRDEVKLKLELNRNKIISARRVNSSLKYSQILQKDDINIVADILRELGYNDTEVTYVIEKLFVYNKNVVQDKTGKNFYDKYKFINLLSLGYEKFTYPEVSNKNKLYDISDVIINIFENNSDTIEFSDYVKILPVIGVEVNDFNELEFVLIRVLETLRQKLDDMIDLIKDEDFVMDLDTKNEISADCYKLIYQYNSIRKYMDIEKEKHILMDIEYIEDDIHEDKNNLFYLANESGKCYLSSDMEDMPFEYLEKVWSLIEDFKSDIISKKKNKMMTENKNARGFKELKGDQIRVIYKKIKDNDYLVYGAFIKKDDRKYRKQFDAVIKRTGNICESSLDVENELSNYVSENSRKWSR